MNCRWIATGIAVIVSIPLAPVVMKNVERLVGANDPVIVTTPTWKVEDSSTASAESNSTPSQNSNGHVRIIRDGRNHVPVLCQFNGTAIASIPPTSQTLQSGGSVTFALNLQAPSYGFSGAFASNPATSGAGTLLFWE